MDGLARAAPWIRRSSRRMTAEGREHEISMADQSKASLAEMRRILGEIRDGSFARELVEEFDSGRPNFLKRREALHAEQIEQVGAKLRPLMSWLAADEEAED